MTPPNKDVLYSISHSLDLINDALWMPYKSETDFPARDAQAKAREYNERIKRQRALVDDPASIRRRQLVYAQVLSRFTKALPPAAFGTPDPATIAFEVPLHDLIVDVQAMVEACTEPFYAERELFMRIIQQFEENKEKVREKTLYSCLHGTPFVGHNNAFEVPLLLPLEDRMEHHWIVAPQGAGKTQTLQYLIARDMVRMSRDECSIVVMDSQEDLIRTISHLPFFRQHPEKLLILDPSDLIPINLFSMGKKRRSSEALVNHTLDLLTYCFDSLLDAPLTPKQSTLFNAIIRVCMEIPNATLETFNDILLNKYDQYETYIEAAGPQTRAFFETQYRDKSFEPTKQEVAWRLSYLRQASVFEQMFSPTPSTLDFFEELGNAKVILINTNRNLLASRTAIFGRMWIALILQAAQQRADLARAARLPVYCYIDELQDYAANDPKLVQILDQARKQNIGMILAHQRAAQMSPQVLDALSNCSIRMSRATNDPFVAKALQSSPEFVDRQPEHHFALYVRGKTRNAASVWVHFFLMEKAEPIHDWEVQAIMEENKKRYAAAAPPAPSTTTEGPDPDF